MATIGLDGLYYAKITENANGEETYGTPTKLAKAISVDLSIELAEATLFADDGDSETVKEFKAGKISLGVDDIGSQVAADLIGATVDANGVVVSASEDVGQPVAVGFRAKKANGKYRYFWLYKVVFGTPSTSLATKGDSITFSTPTIEGTVMRRNKVGADGKHPWKTEVTEGTAGVPEQTVSTWFDEVYEPNTTADGTSLQTLSIGSLSLTPLFNPKTYNYSATTSNASNVVNATADDAATITLKVNNASASIGSSVTWQSGDNIVSITVTNGDNSKTYTVVVTKA